MTNRIFIPIILFALAVVLHLIARHSYVSPNHQAFLTVLTCALVADGIWQSGKVIAAGETWFPEKPVYLWLARFVAIVIIIVGFLDAAQKVGVPMPVRF